MGLPAELNLPPDYKLPENWAIGITLNEQQVSDLVTQLQRDTPLAQLSHGDAVKVFERLFEIGFSVAKDD